MVVLLCHAIHMSCGMCRCSSCSTTIRRRFSRRRLRFGNLLVVLSDTVRITTVDEDKQEVIVDEPSHGEMFGFASMLQECEHGTTATATDEVVCLEIGRDDLMKLVEQRPLASTC
jgi:CRP-like cAMP-binding protein